MTTKDVDFQLVPPHVHRRNAAERAIHTFKNYFIADLCSTDKDFPLHLWDRLLPQAILSLNLLRSSHLNPRLSAWAQVNGAFTFNRTPITPPGIRVLVHETPDVRTSWAPHAVDGWYIGTASDLYRCYRVWIWETPAERTANTLEWFPTKVTMPLASSVDKVIAGAQYILHALQYPSSGSPRAPLTDSKAVALRSLSNIFLNRHAEAASSPQSPASPHAHSSPPISPSPASTPQRVDASSSPAAPSTTPGRQRVASTTPTPTYANSTGNPGRRRRQQRQKARQTTPNASPPANHSPTPRPQPPARSSPSPPRPPTRSSVPRFRPPTCSQGRPVATSHSAHMAAEILNQPTAPVPALTATAIDRHNALPTHAFWTAHSQVDPTTGASFEYAQQTPTALDKTWPHAAYAAIHPDTGKTVEYTKLRPTQISRH
jgi:hypothetical protein